MKNFWPIVTLGGFGMLVTALVQQGLSRPNTPVTPPEPPPMASATAEPAPAPPKTATPPKPQERLLFTFETEFKNELPKYKGRVGNIEKLARMLNGIHIHPGEVFSFNRVIGPRTKETGFKEAPTYFLGEVVPGVGGGTCQVSSTMYAAALHANVEVVDRRPHSRASNYIPAGLDATVNYPPECYDDKGPVRKPDKRICYDFKFKNPYDFDLIFKFGVGQSATKGKGSLIVWVKGFGKIPKVTTRWAAYGAPPFKVRHRRVSWWKDDRKKLKQSGKPGLRGARLLAIEWPDGKVEKKSVYSKYQPVPEVWHVGLAFEKPEEEKDDAE